MVHEAMTGHERQPQPEKETKWCGSWTIKGRLIDRIFPSEYEITPTVSNKTQEGGHSSTASFFFPTLPLSPQPSNTMILVHKPLPISSPTPARFHRRLPSAPHVSVQPTRTPGLLSIIPKQPPHRPSQPQKSQQRMTPLKENQNQRQNRSPKPANPKAQSVDLQEAIKLPAVESDKPKSVKAQSKNPSSTPDKSHSGRNSQKRSPKDKATAERYCVSQITSRCFWNSFEETQEFSLDTRKAISSISSPTISPSNFRPG